MMAAFEARQQSRQFWAPRVLENPEIFNRFRTMYEQTAVPAFLALPETLNEEREAAITARMKERPVPVMQIVGAEDENAEVNFPVMRDMCPRYHPVIIADSGHYNAIENPHDFNRVVLDFLAGIRTYG
jgi:pimeloyl-ACP methyl ester carboxylesterase